MKNKIFLLLIITGSFLLYSCVTTNLSEQDNNPQLPHSKERTTRLQLKRHQFLKKQSPKKQPQQNHQQTALKHLKSTLN
jgi:hypothetical protein